MFLPYVVNVLLIVARAAAAVAVAYVRFCIDIVRGSPSARHATL